MKEIKWIRIVIAVTCLVGLVFIFLFQRVDLATYLNVGDQPMERYMFNRIVRFLANDVCMIGIIYAIFVERKYLIFSLWVQLAGVILFLIPYFVLKIYLPGYNGPLISFLHRLVVNPTLLLLLIPAFYFQRQNQAR